MATACVGSQSFGAHEVARLDGIEVPPAMAALAREAHKGFQWGAEELQRSAEGVRRVSAEDLQPAVTAWAREAQKGFQWGASAALRGAADLVQDGSQGVVTALNGAAERLAGPVPMFPPATGPSVPQMRLEDLKPGDAVFRKGLPAKVVKVDFAVDPPSLVVRMLETDNEVGTDREHVSLGTDASLHCLADGARVCVVNLQGRPELNTCKGTVTKPQGDSKRWHVRLDSTQEEVSLSSENISVLLA